MYTVDQGYWPGIWCLSAHIWAFWPWQIYIHANGAYEFEFPILTPCSWHSSPGMPSYASYNKHSEKRYGSPLTISNWPDQKWPFRASSFWPLPSLPQEIWRIQEQFCSGNFVSAFQRAMLDQNPSTFGRMRPQIWHNFHPFFDENVKSAIWTWYPNLGLVDATKLVKGLF